jgi:hypothetical protein
VSSPGSPSTPPPAPCAHLDRVDGICTACGHCLHEVVLNGACFFCGTTELDAIALSPKPADQIVPAGRLVRRKPPSGSGSAS